MPRPSLDVGESPTMSIRIPEADKDAVRRYAQEYGVKPSVYVRAVLDAHLGRRCCVQSLSFPCTHDALRG